VSFLTAFDAPVMTLNCERRSSSTGAQQSLMLMNSEFVLKQAGQFAERVRREAAGTPLPQMVAYAWNVAYQRPAAAEEVELGCQFVLAQMTELRASGDKTNHELTALASLCQQLLSSNEFLYAD
jgi:hypothetical protein